MRLVLERKRLGLAVVAEAYTTTVQRRKPPMSYFTTVQQFRHVVQRLPTKHLELLEIAHVHLVVLAKRDGVYNRRLQPKIPLESRLLRTMLGLFSFSVKNCIWLLLPLDHRLD